jgi:hypothetical protein
MRTQTFVALAVALAVALPAQAVDYPTKPDEMDKLCEVIGEAPNLSIPPKDRLWFKENCTCAGLAGCGNFGSGRFTQRVAAVAAALEAKTKADADARVRAQKEKVEDTCSMYATCRDTRSDTECGADRGACLLACWAVEGSGEPVPTCSRARALTASK